MNEMSIKIRYGEKEFTVKGFSNNTTFEHCSKILEPRNPKFSIGQELEMKVEDKYKKGINKILEITYSEVAKDNIYTVYCIGSKVSYFIQEKELIKCSG